MQDGTRRDDGFRQRQHDWYLAQLQNVHCPVLRLDKDTPTRVRNAAHWLNRVLGVHTSASQEADRPANSGPTWLAQRMLPPGPISNW